MASFPVELLVGIYLGLLTGVIPALISWILGFTVRYFTGISIPGFGVVVLGLAVAGVQGGLLALSDQSVISAGARIPVAIVVIVMMTLYTHAKGDAMGTSFPKRVSFRSLRERTLSSELVDRVSGEARVRVHGTVEDIEGYPALGNDLRERVGEFGASLPADLSLGELETRFADRLRAEFDLAEVTVRVDERGRATVAAAPPLSGLSKRVPDGERAVSVDTLVPTGLAPGDEVSVRTAERPVDSTVLGVPPDPTTDDGAADTVDDDATSADDTPRPRSIRATGGEGRVTLAVPRSDAATVLAADSPTLVVGARGERREFELLSLLRRAGRRVRRYSVAGGDLAGSTLGEVNVREAHDVTVLAVRHEGRWRFAPRGETRVESGDELFAVGTNGALDRFSEVVA
ncbi:cation:proton antiporter regulatory subunit [Halomarina oriensis]|uniref:Potassium transporter TrkA n=1 Tax=Halomarina oriensis TaxID=671145 RepID=A0A6B0GJS1_9EURY|nr:TrkA C-terminal domain-containing protein [Halomarina oriensis]MWG35092.1 potassium transporter TrkA [Halomarina oriensis]